VLCDNLSTHKYCSQYHQKRIKQEYTRINRKRIKQEYTSINRKELNRNTPGSTEKVEADQKIFSVFV